MIKKFLHHLIISTLITLSPTAAGLFLWNKLPDTMNSHWGFDGTSNSSSTKVFCVFALPLILLAIHYLCIFITAHDGKNNRQNKKMLLSVFYIVPCLSVYSSAIIYADALGFDFDIGKITLILIGAMFLFLGNFLPKCTQNSTVGIKLPWTLADEENWNKTHRLAGKLWVTTGFIILMCVFLPPEIFAYILVITLLTTALVPCVYSYTLYRKSIAQGSAVSVTNKKTLIITVIILALMFSGAFLIGNSDNITYDYNDNSFSVNAALWSDITVSYDNIESIELLDKCEDGWRTNGFGGLKVLLGSFENSQFGNYTRYTYNKCDSCVYLLVSGNVLILNGETKEETEKIYHTLKDKIQ